MRKAHNNKRDENEGEIVDALRKVGCTVERLDQPLDLLVGYAGKCFLLEVKTDKGRLTEYQQVFLDTWRGHAAVVKSPEEAIKTVIGDYLGFA